MVNMLVARPFSRPQPVYQVEDAGSSIFLTFDVLWQTDYLDSLLACLDELGIKTVFFITGEWLEKNCGEAQKIIDHGHHLGNHTFSHAKLLLLTEEEITGEISKFNERCKELLNYRPFLFRPPYGEYNAKIVRIAREQNLHTVLWSINLKTISERETELIIGHLEESLHDGAILLCHTAFPQVLQVLPEAVAAVEWKGYKIETPLVLKEKAAK